MNIKVIEPKPKKISFFKEMKRHWLIYTMAIPALILLGLFNYFPMFGLLLAFKDFKFPKGILGSDWMNPLFKNFELLYSSSDAINAVKNTLVLNFSFIVIGTLCALALAIMLNEMKHKVYKRITQSLTFLPFFMSWIVVGMFLEGILNYNNGVVNKIIEALGQEKIMFYTEPQYWPAILVIESVWKGVGYSAVVYLAAITGIDTAYYEAAEIDGATRMQRIVHVTLPLLRPTIIILVLLALGRIMNADFGMFYYSTNGIYALWSTTDVIETFIYRGLRVTGDIGIASATGFFQSIVSLVVVLSFNFLARKIDRDSALF